MTGGLQRIAVSPEPFGGVVGRVPFVAPDGSYSLRLASVPGLDVIELPPVVGWLLFQQVSSGLSVLPVATNLGEGA